MAYDEALAERIRAILGPRASTERKMFGGIAFMVNGHMACGVINDDLMIRLAEDDHDAAMAEPHVRIMDLTHRTLRGFLYVGADGTRSQADLARWVDRAAAHAESRPPK